MEWVQMREGVELAVGTAKGGTPCSAPAPGAWACPEQGALDANAEWLSPTVPVSSRQLHPVFNLVF